ncbi:DNA helicase-2 / ATP-dependent DNA helicase PcrA [Paenibacillus sp. 1_12]|uniref:RNA polymerase recycling motor HelD n=1 Tax=Paenibacillus sp. 1_12 TaxID=1566278 RepID=UPI0008DF2A2B|nr:RNA polymerase recycling motor HelD [Paenibacillus sp. 1_12]SFM14770.1 DNA helicase-2 / ATP-dependent DNA helicase PcrA [Paenibacillus sp. 1_12]
MSMTEQQWNEEQRRVNDVTGLMELQIEQLEGEVGEVRGEVVDIRTHFWDDVTVNMGTAEDSAETLSNLKQQVEMLSERERTHRIAYSALKKLNRMVKSPYFGRIDFKENGIQGTEMIYLGIASFMDERDDTFLVYDWRAPVSSLYYDYPPGPSSYETPGGLIEGEMLLKRQYVIRDGDIRLMFDTGVTIGDELLQQVLSRSSDAQMKSIVATIQKEQNQIIRNDRSRMLIVQGAAGSGKTSSALQRVAYLLYKNRETLQADQMLLFSPNPMFNSYVSTVLPELGEENMLQTTFQQYLESRIGRDFQLEDPFIQIEYVLSAPEDVEYAARNSGIRYKSSVDYLMVMDAYKTWLEKQGMNFISIRFKGREVVSSRRIKERFYSYDSSIRLANRVVLLRDWLLKEINAFEKLERNMPWVEEEIELLDIDDYRRAFKEQQRIQKEKGTTFDDFDVEKSYLARMVVHDRLKPLRRRVKQLRFVNVRALYRQLFEKEGLFSSLSGEAAVPEYWSEICRQTIQRLEQSELAYEDVTPYLYLLELVQGFQTNTSIRHVIIDEAQDYSPFQLHFLKRLFPRCRMTALGDVNQGIYAHASSLGEHDPIARLYGAEQTELIRLMRSYRSTREIVEFTRGMVPGGEDIVPFNRSGEKPRVIVATEQELLHSHMIADLLALIADQYESIAVICKTANESVGVYEALKEHLPLRLITKQTPSFEKGVLVIPSYLAKGVEFDAVIIYNGSRERYSRENERKLFYTACTRAMHLLYIYSLGQPSPFITSQADDTYLYMNC